MLQFIQLVKNLFFWNGDLRGSDGVCVLCDVVGTAIDIVRRVTRTV